MKKFISLLIASAMVVSLVPATAFAGQDVSATAKVVGATTVTETSNADGIDTLIDGTAPEVQIKIADASYSGADAATGATPTMEVVLTLDDAVFTDWDKTATSDITYTGTFDYSLETGSDVTAAGVVTDDDELTITISGTLAADDVIKIPLVVTYELSAGDTATVSIESDMVEADDIVFLTVADTGIEASIKELSTVAEDEVVKLSEKVVIEETVEGTFVGGYILVMELSKGFEFGSSAPSMVGASGYKYEDEYASVSVDFGSESDIDEIKLEDLQIIADGASEGDVATIEFKLYKAGSDYDDVLSKDKIAECDLEVAEVCDYTVKISVDEDEDVPVFYNGTDVDNTGLNDDADHISLEVTITESFAGAWDDKEFSLTLPEGVYVTAVDIDDENLSWNWTVEVGEDYASAADKAFAKAYQEGDYEGFVFEKRVFDENDPNNEAYEMVFTLELVAAPDFEGEVVLGFVGDAVVEDEVVIAEFVSAYTIEAQQNDVIIDYRNTEITTPVIITEAEAELWNDEMVFTFSMEGEYMTFDDEGDVTVDNDDMEVDVDTISSGTGITIAIDSESDDDASVLTWEGIELYMWRSLAAGAYALDVKTTASQAFMAEAIFAPEVNGETKTNAIATDYTKVYFVGDVIDGSGSGEYTGTSYYTVEVCENFVNIVTAGSDQATTFTTKVIVPIGEYYIYSGGTQIELDVPAFISAEGYTMLPVRAVAEAIGVSTSNVLWNGDAQQVTIIYGTKTIAMVIGQSYMTVNGTAIPTDACPEIVEDRTFLPLRDLATALSVTDISWDADTRTASLN